MTAAPSARLSKEQLISLRRLFDEGWHSSPEEKIEAVELLERDGTPPAIDILETAFEMIRIPVTAKNRSEIIHERPRGGRLSARAAQALARVDHPEGIHYLVSALTSRDNHPYLRESAACGLSGCLKPDTFGALAEALADSDPEVRLAALKAIDSCLNKLGKRRCTQLGAVAEALAALLVCPVSRSSGLKDERPLARRLLKLLITPAI